jgi:predicted NBD/HSP70 family sugar kinase
MTDGSLGWLRERNRQRVIATLRERGRVSQAEIARATGLSRTTVSSLVAELKDEGRLAEVNSTVHDTKGGRPAVQLVLQDSSEAVLGIDFGHSHVQVAIADLGHNVLAERLTLFDVDHNAQGSLDMSVSMVEQALEEAKVRRLDVIGVGIGIPGPVDPARGMVGSATILPGWLGLRIADEMERRLQKSVQIENDANLGALAELTWGAGRDCSNFTYVKASTGIGSGIVIDRKLLVGATGTAGEIGHTTLGEAGALCHCGNRGCLETVASGPAIVRLVSQSKGENLALSRIVALALEGDISCRRAISDAGREIGVAVAGMCNIINPERVIIGGQLSRAGDLLLDPIRDSIRRCAVLAAAERVEVVPAVFVERAELLGALALAIATANPARTLRMQMPLPQAAAARSISGP